MIRAEQISIKNDEYRKRLSGCKVLLTSALAHSEDKGLVLEAVRNFHTFNRDNDPYGEHDFGSLEINGTTYFWKFDYYDDTYECFQEDGHRVLTIGRMDEY